ncbi:transposase family protein [Saccharothrix sp. S26]|uniref:transposase family protein n=1 Tax=Saccharothrix sp. S26 TaxID=2907215 RepID=UPI001F22409D|nr:transposase family protein [Saccharothrix sp. S26]MCE6995616.1 transposase family protein [Saccharothrix sp. S26]
MIDLFSPRLQFVIQQLRVHRRRIGSRLRHLEPGRQGLLVLAHLCCGATYARLAAGFDIGLATLGRYIHEAVQLRTAPAPPRTDAVKLAARKPYVTHLSIDRIAVDRPYYWKGVSFKPAFRALRLGEGHSFAVSTDTGVPILRLTLALPRTAVMPGATATIYRSVVISELLLNLRKNLIHRQCVRCSDGYKLLITERRGKPGYLPKLI